jgi:uncharacterized membrane protein YkvA (DUF1232 family)
MTTDVDARCLETFPEWLRTLGADATALADALADGAAPEEARRILAGAINYLFKSVDLIPDGIDDIGYLDDAFVLRLATAQAVAAGLAGDAAAALAADAALVKDFLGADHARLDRYVTGLRKGSARGRSVDAIVADAAVRRELAADVAGFAGAYGAPSFAREQRTLIKLRAFFDARLPR